jgi:hypothetical protein
MKKLLLGLTLLASMSSFANSSQRVCGKIGKMYTSHTEYVNFFIVGSNLKLIAVGGVNASILATAKAFNQDICLSEGIEDDQSSKSIRVSSIFLMN